MEHVEAIVVGAGFGGMGAAIQLQRSGIEDFVILEREDDLGGTWHVNRYPGLAVDIPSTTYSYSFAPNPHWSRLFAPGEELKAYADHIAETYDLRRRMRFGAVVEGARWDDSARHWVVSVADAAPLSATYLITATGFLSQPKVPDIAGIDSFAGEVVHSTDWSSEVDLRGKRAAVIGTGATAVQLIPEIARDVAALTVFQRTPIWVVPKVDGPVPRVARSLFARVPLTQRLARMVSDTVLEGIMVTGVLHYRQARAFNRGAEALARAHLRRQVSDPGLREQLTPDYSFGCKRPTFSNHYFRTFTEPHVQLETDTIDHVEPGAIVTAGGRRHEIDTLVLATGFDLWQVNFPAIEIVGREGRNLGAWWRAQRFGSYQGVSVPGFPNYISLTSPYSYSGLSYFSTIESQMIHLDRLLAEMRRRGAATFEVREQAYEEFIERMRGRLDDSVFHLGQCATARSYYFNQHGEAAILRPTSTAHAFREQARFPLEDYALA